MKLDLNTVLNALLVLLIALYIGRYFYLQPKFVNGERAPELRGQLVSGEPWSLSELRGHYVLLDFWGSWCPPCRKANPGWVALYDRFQGAAFVGAEGFEIVSVGVERDPERWRQAIARDGLRWPYHLLDRTESLRFFDGTLAESYGVKKLPTSYFIDPSGQIIGVNLDPEEVAERLEAARRDGS